MKKENLWLVYIVETRDGRLYTGITKDLKRRMDQHRQGPHKGGAKFFSLSRPQKIIFTQKFQARGPAAKREAEIKKLTRKQKLSLIKNFSQ